MSLLDDLTGATWFKPIAILVAVVAMVGLTLLVNHWRLQSGKVDAITADNAQLVKQAAADAGIIKDLTDFKTAQTAKAKQTDGDFNADAKKNPSGYDCALPASGVRILNGALASPD